MCACLDIHVFIYIYLLGDYLSHGRISRETRFTQDITLRSRRKEFLEKKPVMIMLKNSLNQCRLVEVSFLRNVNFEFVTCLQIKIVTPNFIIVIILKTHTQMRYLYSGTLVIKTSLTNKSSCNTYSNFHPYKLPITNTPKMLN